MTSKGYNNDIQTIEPNKTKEKIDMSKWIYHLEESTIWVTREVNQMTVLIKYKTEKQFTAHQKQLWDKFWKRCGNAKMTRLKFKLTLLKKIWKVRLRSSNTKRKL